MRPVILNFGYYIPVQDYANFIRASITAQLHVLACACLTLVAERAMFRLRLHSAAVAQW